MWVGGRNVGSENSWYWSDGEPWFDAVLWGSGEKTFINIKTPLCTDYPFDRLVKGMVSKAADKVGLGEGESALDLQYLQ